MSKIENLELKKLLTLDIIGSRGLNMYASVLPAFDDSGKLLKKRIGQIGTTLAKPANELRIALREDNVIVGFARVANRDNWRITDKDDTNETTYERAATIRSGYAEKPKPEQLLDMRFDSVQSVRGLLNRFYPNLKVSGTGDTQVLRSVYGESLIEGVLIAMGFGLSNEDITKRMQKDITDEKWAAIMTACETEHAETETDETD